MNTSSLTGKASKALYKIVLLGLLLSLFLGLAPVTPARAVPATGVLKGAVRTHTTTKPDYGTVFAQTLDDAQSTTGPKPPPQAMRPDSLTYLPGIGSHLIGNVPAYYWRHGCGPTAAGMLIGYWDQHFDALGVDWLFSGDATTETAVVDEDIASTQGTQNHYTDYVLPMETDTSGLLPDRSVLPPGNQHPDNSIADFMLTSRSSVGNEYGWSWFSDVRPALLDYISMFNPGEFIASSSNYYYSNGSFNWNMFKTEIDAGRPMVLLVDSTGDGYTDHFIPAFGYDDSTGVQMYAAYNTWDYSLHWYQFGPMTVGKPWGIYGGTTLNIKADPQADIYVGGARQGSFILSHGQSARVSYGTLNNGPVLVQNLGSVPIVASERVAYTPDGGTTWTNYSELMGLPIGQLTTVYVMPWYNNADLNTQLRFGNVGTSSTTVTVTVGGVVQGTYPLDPSQSTRVSYTGLNNGPVAVSSSGGVPIIASERAAYYNGSAWTSYSELMGLPAGQLTSIYVMPWYNNADLNTQLRFGNVGTSSTVVTVTVGGVVQGTYPLDPSQSTRVSYTGLNNGPVVVSSSGGVPIIASQRVAYTNGSAWTSYSELMGLPMGQLTTSYVMPWYNNANLNTQLRFATVGNASTTVTVTIGGVVQGTYPLAPNQSARVSYTGLNNGPVVVSSSGGVPIIASQRVAYYNGSAWTSFSELMGLPFSQLATTYVMPWYNNADLNTQLRIGVP